MLPLSFRTGASALAIIALTATSFTSPARAETLAEALAATYENNPRILAERQAVRAIDESYAQATANWRPTVTASASVGYTEETSERSFANSEEQREPRSVAVAVNQPLYRGGRTTAAQSAALSTIYQARATLHSVVQQVLLDAVTAYTGVIQAKAILDLNSGNEEVLRRNLEATQDRFRVGEVTLTDSAQAESRLARATAATINARGQYQAAQATYARIIGAPPQGSISSPTLNPDMPASLEEALQLARAENPQLLAAGHARKAADYTIRERKGALYPELSANAEASKADGVSALGGEQDTVAVTARLTVPLYQGGSAYSRVREAQQIAGQRRAEMLDTNRIVEEQVISAWEIWVAAKAQRDALASEIRAAEIALDGVRQEAMVGARTVLDVLDAEQELLNARVNRVTAERDEVNSRFGVLAAIGRLQPQFLGLDVATYDEAAYFGNIRGQWFGFSDTIVD